MSYTFGCGMVRKGRSRGPFGELTRRFWFRANGLEPKHISPVIDEFLDARREEGYRSIADFRSSLGFFGRWCAEVGIQTTAGLSYEGLKQFRDWRRYDAPVKVDELDITSVNTQMKRVKTFLRYCEREGYVAEGFPDEVAKLRIKDNGDARSEMLETERATEVLEFLERFHYASRDHVVMSLLALTGGRLGDVRALDLCDVDRDSDPPRLEFYHRPELGTPLKNNKEGERYVALSEKGLRILDDYLDKHRDKVEDEYGRKPLVTTPHGRIAKSTIRKYSYMWTRPCVVSGECPIGRDPSTCDAMDNSKASKCPESRSPHPVRRGYITHEATVGTDLRDLSDECDVSIDVMKKHYNRATKEQELSRRYESRSKNDKPLYGETPGEGVWSEDLDGDDDDRSTPAAAV